MMNRVIAQPPLMEFNKVAIVTECGMSKGAESLLASALKQAGLVKESCYITSLVKYEAPGNKIEKLFASGIKWQDFLGDLKSEMEGVKPNIIVPMGSYALLAICNKPDLMNWRGSIIESTLVAGVKVIPTIFPGDILSMYKWKPLLILDLKKVNKERTLPAINLPERKLLIEPTLSEAKMWIDVLMKPEIDKVAFDIEVDIQGIISCIGFSPSPNLAMCIPFKKGVGNYWMEGEEYIIWEWIKELFQQEGKQWIAQNALFDLRWLVHKVGWIRIWMDTMIAHQLCYSEIAKGLDMLASIYTNEPYYKDARKVWKEGSVSSKLYTYNCRDAAVTYEVAERLEEEIKALKMEEFFYGFVMKMIPILFLLNKRGIRVDRGVKDKLMNEYKDKIKVMEEGFEGVNVSSPKQLQVLLYEKMGMPKQYNKKTGKVSTGKEALIKLRGKIK